jgi:glycosyltransferase involved in cell wall biosynthesis
MQSTEPQVAVSWVELPHYGARLVREGIHALGRPVAVLSKRPQRPIEGVEDTLGQRVHWLNGDEIWSWKQLGLPVPRVFFQAGWYVPSFIRLGAEVRRNGGQVVCLADNSWKNSARQWLGAVRFRLTYRAWFSAVWVPGYSGTRLMRFFGMPPARIYQGLYGGDPSCFAPGGSLTSRDKQFIFVGRLIPLKGIDTLARAFDAFHRTHWDWKLVVYGSGECRPLLENRPGVVLNPFSAPPQVAEALRQARFLILPSTSDHWPLVVAEAALAGCGFILSDRVGNRDEFVDEKNGFVFPARSAWQLFRRMKEAAAIPNSQLEQVSIISRRRGEAFSPKRWAEVFGQILRDLGAHNPS